MLIEARCLSIKTMKMLHQKWELDSFKEVWTTLMKIMSFWNESVIGDCLMHGVPLAANRQNNGAVSIPCTNATYSCSHFFKWIQLPFPESS